MDHDLDELRALLDVLTAAGVVEYSSGDVRLVIRPKYDAHVVDVPVSPAAVDAAKRSRYAALFPVGRVPSFEDFKMAGLVTEEK